MQQLVDPVSKLHVVSRGIVFLCRDVMGAEHEKVNPI